MTKVKFCGLRREADARLVNALRPDYAGVILAKGFGRSVDGKTAGQIREVLDPAIPLVGVFVDDEVSVIRSALEAGIIQIVQLHGQEDPDTIRQVQALGAPVWKAFQMQPGMEQTVEASPADGVLLDAGRGSGETFDWSVTEKIGRPFLLAGGLTPENVRSAILQVRPYGVDVSSGVETDGYKDEQKMAAFIQAVRET